MREGSMGAGKRGSEHVVADQLAFCPLVLMPTL